MTRPLSRFACLGVVLALFTLPTASAHASHVQCGDVITQDTTLDSDLVNCPGNGVVIGADGITLDLGGHLIDGIPEQSQYGVDAGGHDRVTVENGSIRQFTYGALLTHSDDGRVAEVDLRETFTGVRIEMGSRNLVERSAISAYSAAIQISGISNANSVEDNVLTGSGNGVLTLPGPPSLQTPIPRFNRIVGNTISGNQYGIFGYGYFMTIERNLFDANSEAGIELISGIDNDLAANRLRDNGGGIELEGQTSDTAVSRNQIVDSDEDGISLSSAATGPIVIERNTTSVNGDDGIDVDSEHATITKNTANDNGDLGIEAIPGVTDGGGNKARGNGNPLQCLNVACK